MSVRNLTCIGCPLGCPVSVTLDGDRVAEITGYTCPRGKAYAEKEVTAPTRIVTSTVRVVGGSAPVTSVKTASDVPKSLIFEVMAEINRAAAQAPVEIGTVVLENVAGTGVNVVATKAVEVAK
ncbi:MAG: DUF1667 domain-containing protein [Oscillospiraceae bacterium]|nr:DUF1667 domain-containing protein [Oscillospiraceae bacterium]